jgi:hypothetical protein
MAARRGCETVVALETPGDPNVPARSLQGIIEPLDLAGEFIDGPDQAFVDVSLRDLPLRLAQKMVDARSRLPHGHFTEIAVTSISSVAELFREISR